MRLGPGAGSPGDAGSVAKPIKQFRFFVEGSQVRFVRPKLPSWVPCEGFPSDFSFCVFFPAMRCVDILHVPDSVPTRCVAAFICICNAETLTTKKRTAEQLRANQYKQSSSDSKSFALSN